MKSMKPVMFILISLFIGGCATLPSAKEITDREITRAWNLGNYSKVIELAEQCAESDPRCALYVADSYYYLKQYPEAIKYYETCLSLGGKDLRHKTLEGKIFPSFSYFNLGESYYKTRQYEKALETFKYMLGIGNDAGVQVVASSYIISIYRELGQFENAETYAKRLIKVTPQSSNGYIELGAVYVDQGKYDEAISTLKPFSDNDGAIVLLGKAYLGKKQYNDAISYYKKALELKPKDIGRYIGLAQIYNEMENFGEAIGTLKKALEIEPNNVWLYSKLTNSYMADGRFDDAIKLINKAVEDIYVIRGIGLAIAIEEKYPVVKDLIPSGPAKKAGIEVGDKIMKINGQSTKEWDINKATENLRGQEGTQVTLTIERKGGDKPLEKIITREKMITAGAATPLGMRSLINAIKGNFGEARKDAEKAYSLNQNNGWARGALSFAYILEGPPLAKEGKIAEAIKILSGTENNFDRLLEALAYSKMGDLKKSFDIYTSIPEGYLQSKNVFRQQFRNAVLESLAPYVEDKKRSAKSLEAKGQYRDALKEYVEILKIAEEKEAKEIRGHVAMLIKARPIIAQLPEEARKHALRAEVATKEGKFADAIKEYKEALKISPFFPQIYKAQALNYEALKDYNQAITNLKIYLELYPDAPDAREAKDQIYKWEFMLEKGGK